MNEGIKERISALMDGELSEFETRRVLEEIEANTDLRDYWRRIQIIKSGLKDQSLGYLNQDISKKLATELGEPFEQQEKTFTTDGKRTFLYTATAAGLATIASAIIFTSDERQISPEELFVFETSKQIEKAISSPQAMQVLNKALLGMDVTLQELNSGKRGQVYANYKFPSNGKTFRISLSPVSSFPALENSRSNKLAYLETNNGVFIISVSGDISSEKKSQILRHANFSINKLN